MCVKKLLYALELKAVACCGQSDGYLMSWAREKIKQIPENDNKSKAGKGKMARFSKN